MLGQEEVEVVCMHVRKVGVDVDVQFFDGFVVLFVDMCSSTSCCVC